jgi:pyridinium-3,5-bisthiocarboxylic acid mononucleotide nickel chelatase
MDRLFEAGALDVSLTAVHMKKNRPGTQIQVLSDPAQVEEMRMILFQETTTLGVKQYPVQRFALPRETRLVTTRHGDIRLKIATLPDGKRKISPEFEDCSKLARESGLPFQTVYQEALAAYRAEFED